MVTAKSEPIHSTFGDCMQAMCGFRLIEYDCMRHADKVKKMQSWTEQHRLGQVSWHDTDQHKDDTSPGKTAFSKQTVSRQQVEIK